MSERPVISVATSCFNEKENIRLFYDRVRAVLKEFPEYDYEFVVSDNCSAARSKNTPSIRAVPRWSATPRPTSSPERRQTSSPWRRPTDMETWMN